MRTKKNSRIEWMTLGCLTLAILFAAISIGAGLAIIVWVCKDLM